jgi:hypothetical protein
MLPDLVPYVKLLRAYTEDRLSEDEFSLIYVMMFKRDPAMREQAVFDLLQDVFSAADNLLTWCGSE